MRYFLLILFLLPSICWAQCRTYKISVKGDTLNCTDNNNLKQGKWVIHSDGVRGEPGYEEEGVFKDGKKEGPWRSYNLMGDLLSIENYKWGCKNSTSYYYSIYGLEREENWKATNPDNPYDTIDVPDLHSDAVYKRVIKIDASTVRHGVWKYYDPQTGLLQKTEEYVFDKLVDPRKKNLAGNLSDSAGVAKKDTLASSKTKPPEVLEYEKKNSGKKKIKVRDGATGVH